MNNGNRYPETIKERARVLRENGFTHREIAEELGTSWSIVFLWTKGIMLTPKQKRAIQERRYKPTFTRERRERLSESARKYLSLYWKPTPTDQELIQRIIDFYKKHKRIPLKREFNNTYEEYRKRFDSWNNAIRLAGFSPNPVIFSKKFIAKDGHICDSFAEKIIDDWLFKHKIKHKKNFPYSNQKMTADFAIGNVRIEYFGLQGLNKVYDRSIQIKRKMCQKDKLRLLEIYPSKLFSKNFKSCLGIILQKLKD